MLTPVAAAAASVRIAAEREPSAVAAPSVQALLSFLSDSRNRHRISLYRYAVRRSYCKTPFGTPPSFLSFAMAFRAK